MGQIQIYGEYGIKTIIKGFKVTKKDDCDWIGYDENNNIICIIDANEDVHYEPKDFDFKESNNE